jgi:large repetitive protein
MRTTRTAIDPTRTAPVQSTRTRPGRRGRGRRALVGAAAAVALVLAQSAVGTAYAVAPTEAPTLLGPVDGAQTAGNPVLTWTSVPGAVKYRVQVSATAAFTLPVAYTADVPVTTSTPPTELPNAVLYWRVAATDGSVSGVGGWSQILTFKKTVGAAPTVVAPADGTTFAYPGQTPILRWSPLPGAKSYNVEIDDEDGFTSAPVVSTANTAYAVTTGLTFGTRYYWRVSGVTPNGNATSASEARSFLVSWPVDPTHAGFDGKPDLTGPPSGTLVPVNDVVLTWAPVPGAAHYLLTVGDTHDFANTLVEDETVVRGTQYSPPTEYLEGQAFWKVVAVDTLGRQGPPSDIWTFRRATPEPSVPTLLSPDPGAAVTEWSFSWTPVPGAGAYEFEWATDIGFGSSQGLCSTFHTSVSGSSRLPGGILNTDYPKEGSACSPPKGGTYYWHVRAIDIVPDTRWGQTDAWSATRAITYSVATQNAGTLTTEPVNGYLAPADCEAPDCTTLLPDTPQLSWAAVPGAGYYYVHLATMPSFSTESAVYKVAGTHLTPRESLPDNATDGAYYWWVQPCAGTYAIPGDCAALSPGDAVAFRKLTPSVELAAPADAVTVTDVVPLSWADPFTTHPDATGAAAYRVQISTSPDYTLASTRISELVDETSFEAVDSLLADGFYYWRVQAVDGAKLDLTPSDDRTFTKVSSKPATLTATQIEGTALPVLSWDSLPYVGSYVVEIYTGTDPTFPASAKTSFGAIADLLPAYTPAKAMPAGTYSWRVRRVDSSLNPGPWTVTDADGNLPTFTVTAPKPTLQSPVDGLTVLPNDLVFTWDAVAGAAQYKFESSTSAGFTTFIESQPTVMTTWATMVTTYPNGVPVRWRVKALDGAGNVLSTSDVRTVIRDGAGPVATITTTGATTTLRPSVKVAFSEVVHGVTPTSVLLRSATGATLATSGVCAYVAAAVVPCSGDGVRSVTLTATANVVPGQTYSVVVTSAVVDGMGNAGTACTSSFRSLRLVEQNAGSAAWSSGWATVKTTIASGGSYARHGTKGASMSWTFVGTSARLGFVAARTNGKALVYIDGKLRATLDQYGSTSARRTYSVTGLTNAQHVLRVVVAGLRSSTATGYYVSVDVLSTG